MLEIDNRGLEFVEFRADVSILRDVFAVVQWKSVSVCCDLFRGLVRRSCETCKYMVGQDHDTDRRMYRVTGKPSLRLMPRSSRLSI